MEDHEPKYIQFYFTLSPLMKSLLPSMTIKFDEQHNCRNALSFILNLDRFVTCINLKLPKKKFMPYI